MAMPQLDMGRVILAGALGTGATFLLTYLPSKPPNGQGAENAAIIATPEEEPVYQTSSEEDDPMFDIERVGPRPVQGQPLEKAQFIVRVKGSDAVDECIAMYHRDKVAGRKLFSAWADVKPELKGFRLVRANYSGELILSYTSRDGGRSVKAAQKELLALENIRYADLDEYVTIEEEK